MAAKNKRAKRVDPGDAAAADWGAHGGANTLLRASRHRQDLLDEARALLAEGRVREARAVEKRASQVEQLVSALESDTRPPGNLAH